MGTFQEKQLFHSIFVSLLNPNEQLKGKIFSLGTMEANSFLNPFALRTNVLAVLSATGLMSSP